MFTVEPDGDDDLRVSGDFDLTAGGDVTDFVWSPNSRFIAYRANQDNVINFELYVTTPDDSSNDTKVSGDSIAGDVDPIFEWSPDSARVAYRADQRFVGDIELFTATPDGEENDRVSGDLSSGGNVEEFIWARTVQASGISPIRKMTGFSNYLDPHRMAMKRPRFPVRSLTPVMFYSLNGHLNRIQIADDREEILGFRCRCSGFRPAAGLKSLRAAGGRLI